MIDFNELTARLGIKNYPPPLQDLYDGKKDGSFCPPEYAAELEKKYGLLGEYANLVVEAAREVASRAELNAWGWVCRLYNATSRLRESQMLHMPLSDGSLAMDMLPVLILLCDVPRAVELYEARGFSSEQIKKNLGNIRINIWVNEVLFGRPMLTDGYYSWLRLYMHAEIFDHGLFNFQPAVWGNVAIYLKSKRTGAILPMMTSGRFHRSGLALGSEGASDEDGSFDAEFRESDELFTGHLVRDGRVEPETKDLLKSEWECILREGDGVVSLHIPRGTDLSPEGVTACIREGFLLTERHYPELMPKFVVCYSWLLDPQLQKMLGERTKLASFNIRFKKHPINDPSLCCLGYIFPGRQSDPVDTFPEGTSLQRAVKTLMLEGGFIRGTAGVIFESFKE